MLKKIISGGQTGADRAGLDVAIAKGIPHGGWIPKGIKQIARETGHSKNTLKKVLRGEYGGYKPRIGQPYPVLGLYIKWPPDVCYTEVFEAIIE